MILFQKPPTWWYFFALGGLSVLGFFAYLVPWLSVYKPYLQSTFLLVVFIHVLEAVYAFILAQHPKLRPYQWQWVGQTLFLGIYSLILLKRIRQNLGV